jgi:hypothetical protein
MALLRKTKIVFNKEIRTPNGEHVIANAGADGCIVDSFDDSEDTFVVVNSANLVQFIANKEDFEAIE